MMGVFSPRVQYPIDVTQDLLLIYNTNSVNSSKVCAYYLANRPMVRNANVLPIGCPPQFTVLPSDYTNLVQAPVQNWLAAHPTKHPQYIILFVDVPSSYNQLANSGANHPVPHYPSVSVSLRSSITGIPPFITHINMRVPWNFGRPDASPCYAYIDKLRTIGRKCAPGKVIISASGGGYGNSHWYFDGAGSEVDTFSAPASRQVLAADPSAQIEATTGYDGMTNLALHITNGAGVAGYFCLGAHSALDQYYAVGRTAGHGLVRWQGRSAWWIMATDESFNGIPDSGQGNFYQWFSASAFGGTNYSNTPVGGVGHVEEPGFLEVGTGQYYGLWAAGKTFAACAWCSRYDSGQFFEAVGDPLVTR